MRLRETLVFVPRPLDVVASGSVSGDWRSVRIDDETAILLGGDFETASMGFASEDGAPGWSQLLLRDPDDVPAIAAALTSVGADPAELAVSKDWNGRALADLAGIRRSMAAASV